MNIIAPVQFDNGTTFLPDGNSHSWNKVNGYDSTGCRITNIVGHDGHDFLKQCSRDTCRVIMRASYFGPEGRFTSGRRDQSNCVDCRGNY